MLRVRARDRNPTGLRSRARATLRYTHLILVRTEAIYEKADCPSGFAVEGRAIESRFQGRMLGFRVQSRIPCAGMSIDHGSVRVDQHLDLYETLGPIGLRFAGVIGLGSRGDLEV